MQTLFFTASIGLLGSAGTTHPEGVYLDTDTPLTVTIPPGVVAGDLLLLLLDSVSSIATPSGWTNIYDEVWAEYGYVSMGCYKIAGSSESDFLITDGSLQILGSITAFRGPTRVATYASAQMLTSYVFPSVTAVENGSVFVTHACDRSTSQPTTPSGQTLIVGGSRQYFGATTAYEMVNTGATGTRTSSGGAPYDARLHSLILDAFDPPPPSNGFELLFNDDQDSRIPARDWIFTNATISSGVVNFTANANQGVRVPIDAELVIGTQDFDLTFEDVTITKPYRW